MPAIFSRAHIDFVYTALTENSYTLSKLAEDFKTDVQTIAAMFVAGHKKYGTAQLRYKQNTGQPSLFKDVQVQEPQEKKVQKINRYTQKKLSIPNVIVRPKATYSNTNWNTYEPGSQAAIKHPSINKI